MTTFTYQGYIVSYNPAGSADTFEISSLDVVVPSADSILRYTRTYTDGQPDDYITIVSPISNLRIGGENVPLSLIYDLDAETEQVSWSGGVSNILSVELGDGRVFLTQMSGNPIPPMSSLSDFNGFLADVTKLQLLDWGVYGPDQDIPLASIMSPGMTENDLLIGDETANTFNGGPGFDTLIGGDGNDILDGGTNPSDQGDIMLGGAGDDTYYVDSALDLVDEGFVFPDAGWGGTDTIISSANWYWDSQSVGEIVRIAEDADDPDGAGVTFVGGVFDNELHGHSGTDILFGRGGNDTYRAGDGVDWISLSTLGLTDENAYAGVDGQNTIIVDPRSTGAFSYDILFEFESGKDKVDVSAYGSQYASGADVLSHAVDDGAGSSYIALGDGLDYLYFVGLSKTELLASDFVV